MRAGELLLFGAVAGGLHLGALFVWSEANNAGMQGGEGGKASISLQAAPAQLAAMAEDWQTPPEMQVTDPSTPKSPLETTRTDNSRAAEPLTQAPPPPPLAPTAETAEVNIIEPAPRSLHGVDSAPSGALPLQQHQPEQIAAAQPSPMAPAPAAPQRPEPAVQTPTAQIDTQAPTPSEVAPKVSARPQDRPAPRPKADPKPRVAATSAPPVEPSQQAKAAGAGNSAKAATGSTRTVTGTQKNAGELRSLKVAWGASIQAKVQSAARSPGVGPTSVRLTLSVARSGKLAGVQIAKGSGNAAADRAAVAAVKRARRFTPAPDALTKAQYHFQITLRFQ